MPGDNAYIGIDVGKTFLDVCVGESDFRVRNCQTGFERLIRRARRFVCQPHVVFEASPHARLLANFLYTQKLPYSAVKPHRPRQFARAFGILAKNDRVDARMLALFGAKMHPKPSKHPTRLEARLLHLSRQRGHLAHRLRTLKVQDHTLWDAGLRVESAALVKLVQGRIAEVDDRLRESIVGRVGLSGLAERLSQVPGIGTVTANRLIAEIPELGKLSRRRIASLAGLVPLLPEAADPKFSGRIHGGRKWLRGTLYMASVVGICRNPVLRPFYQRLRRKGKHHRVAIVAVMRKLLIYLNGIARQHYEGRLAPPAAPVRRGPWWSKSELEMLRQMVAANLPHKEIARRIGRTARAVRSKVDRHAVRFETRKAWLGKYAPIEGG